MAESGGDGHQAMHIKLKGASGLILWQPEVGCATEATGQQETEASSTNAAVPVLTVASEAANTFTHTYRKEVALGGS